jgi:hypothetical protein
VAFLAPYGPPAALDPPRQAALVDDPERIVPAAGILRTAVPGPETNRHEAWLRDATFTGRYKPQTVEVARDELLNPPFLGATGLAPASCCAAIGRIGIIG